MSKEKLKQLLYELCVIQEGITNYIGMRKRYKADEKILLRTEKIDEIVKLFGELQVKYNRILNAAKGWGMPSEMDNPKEVVVLVDGLYRRIERLNERLEKTGLDMPCEFCGGETDHKTNCPRGA